MKRSQYFFKAAICFLLSGCFLMSVACGAKSNQETGNDIENERGTVEIHPNDWEFYGEWNTENNLFRLENEEEDGRIVYRERVNQDYVTISAQVRLETENASAGIEFRTNPEYDPFDYSQSSFALTAGKGFETRYQTGSDWSGKGKKPVDVKLGIWYTLKVVLNGTDGSFYLDGELVDHRTDCAIKEGNENIALRGEGKDTLLRDFKVEIFTPNNLSWDELLEQSALVKEGYDRFTATHFEYPYVGLGRTSLFVSPYGFMTPNVKRPLYIGTAFRDTPQFIYDLWWDGAIKVDPFTFSGGYNVDGDLEEGEMLDDGTCSYKQTVDVQSGVLTTDLTLSVDGEPVKTKREMLVNDDGVVLLKTTNDTQKEFMFRLTTRDSVFGDEKFEKKEDGFLLSCNLRADKNNRAYVRVKAVSEDGFTVQDDGTIVFNATEKPVYIYLAPESDLTFEEVHNPVENAETIVQSAAKSGWENELEEALAWYKDLYSRGKVSIPDLGMAKWYVRSLFYHSVSMAGTRVPPGCYSNNVAGFFGGPCPEFDLTLSQYMLMMTNHTELSQSAVDWYFNTRKQMRYNAEIGYSDKTGHSHQPVPNGYLIPWISGWDGNPTRGVEVAHEQGWVSMFAGANAAGFVLDQAEYLNSDRAFAKDLMMGQLRMMMSFFKKIDGKWLHEGVWAKGDQYAAGSFSESMAAVYSIVTVDAFRKNFAELFTASENAEIDEWVSRLPDMPPYGNQFAVVYDPDKAMYTIGHTTHPVDEMITKGTGFVGGPTNHVYFRYHLLPYDDPNLAGTIISVAESGQFDYHFNTGWSATIAAYAGMADFAYQYSRDMLRPRCLYDDWYMTENVANAEDFKRAPELGAHGTYAMSIASMLFDGTTEEYIKGFPAVTEEWQSIGVDFTRMLAKGNIEVSGTYSNDKTTLILENKSDVDVVRDVYVRVQSGSGAAEYNGKEYDLKDGCMAFIPAVKIAAGQKLTMEVVGTDKDVEIDSFKGLAPVAGSDRVRTEHIPFHWEFSDHASSYRLVISENQDLSNPVFDKNVGQTTLYYPLNTADRINLKRATVYYWTVYGIHGDSERQMEQGVLSFATEGASAVPPVNPLPEGSKLNAFGKEWQICGYAEAVKDGVSVTSLVERNESNPTGIRFETNRDFEVTVTVKANKKGKFGIQLDANKQYFFVRTEDGKINSYGTLAEGGVSTEVKVKKTVTYKMMCKGGVLSTWYRLEGEQEFTKLLQTNLPEAVKGQPMQITLFAISSFTDAQAPVRCVFSNYTENFFE